MADVTINSAATGTAFQGQGRVLVFSSDSVGYAFVINSTTDLVYHKTTDGGQTWGSAVNVDTADIRAFSIWFEKWTPNDSGTKIHIWYYDNTSADLWYNSLDTSGDSLGTAVQITSVATGVGNAACVSGTKTRGGNLLVTAIATSGGDKFNSTWTSADGSSWTDRSVSAYETTVSTDFALCLPGNEADSDDVWAVFWDRDAAELSLKVYDWSAPGWTETSIATSMTLPSATTGFKTQFAASVRHSDGHAIVAAWGDYDVATADLRVWDVNGAASITEKTAVNANVDDCAGAALFIDQNTDDLYVGYIGKSDGTETITSSVKIYYKKSTDDGANWGSETAYSENAAADLRGIWAPVGGSSSRFYLGWFHETNDDLLGGYTNSVAITPPAGGTAVKDIIGGGFIPFAR